MNKFSSLFHRLTNLRRYFLCFRATTKFPDLSGSSHLGVFPKICWISSAVSSNCDLWETNFLHSLTALSLKWKEYDKWQRLLPTPSKGHNLIPNKCSNRRICFYNASVYHLCAPVATDHNATNDKAHEFDDLVFDRGLNDCRAFHPPDHKKTMFQ